MRPPINNDPRTTRSGHPFGKAEINCGDHIAIRADAAPSIVTSPKTSVSKTLVLLVIRFPTKTPIDAPAMIVKTFIRVPIPGNIDAGYADFNVCATTPPGLDSPNEHDSPAGVFPPP